MTRKTAKRIALASVNVRKKPMDWGNDPGPMVLDPDGWRFSFATKTGQFNARSWEDEITYEEFRERARRSTTMLQRPRPGAHGELAI